MWEGKKPIIEDFMLAVLEGDRTFKRLGRVINILCIDLKRKLEPKEVVYLGYGSQKFWETLKAL
ncbi:MAG TPA: hypothetical protein ENF72_03015 [Thermococcus litoralis]|uniref:Uncharacterized protein n=1 Tax=Thermococcus litoralis TaxID=2265 RepID=A0A7C0XZ47_THELI|nr:MAG: hypothetical protein DRN32_06540 [Thermococci archaeon]RLF87930.1 MAG: hypothetical protein DRN34_00575 [Thermococci archaeon]HDD31580.1 hypothetical protein [Thermococcus litoralis]